MPGGGGGCCLQLTGKGRLHIANAVSFSLISLSVGVLTWMLMGASTQRSNRFAWTSGAEWTTLHTWMCFLSVWMHLDKMLLDKMLRSPDSADAARPKVVRHHSQILQINIEGRIGNS